MYSGLRRDDGTHAHKVFARRAAAGGQTDGRLRMGAPHFWHASHARAGGRPRPSGLPSGPSPCSRPSRSDTRASAGCRAQWQMQRASHGGV